MGFPKITYLTLFERLGIVFMKTYEGERNMNAKKINMEMITWVFFWACAPECLRMYRIYTWACEVRVLGIGVMVGPWPLWLLQRCSILVPKESSVNPHFSFPCPNTRLHSLLCKWMRKDICLEFLAFSERWWSLYDMEMFICDRALHNVPI